MARGGFRTRQECKGGADSVSWHEAQLSLGKRRCCNARFVHSRRNSTTPTKHRWSCELTLQDRSQQANELQDRLPPCPRREQDSRADHSCRVCLRRECLSGTKLLVLVWMLITLLLWTLQVQSFLHLALPHSVLPDLVVDEFSTPEAANISTRCPTKGVRVAGRWWNMWVTHNSPRRGGKHVCHFVA
jgi:hypothetical protein